MTNVTRVLHHAKSTLCIIYGRNSSISEAHHQRPKTFFQIMDIYGAIFGYYPLFYDVTYHKPFIGFPNKSMSIHEGVTNLQVCKQSTLSLSFFTQANICFQFRQKRTKMIKIQQQICVLFQCVYQTNIILLLRSG